MYFQSICQLLLRFCKNCNCICFCRVGRSPSPCWKAEFIKIVSILILSVLLGENQHSRLNPQLPKGHRTLKVNFMTKLVKVYQKKSLYYTFALQQKFMSRLGFQVSGAEAENKLLFNPILHSRDRTKKKKHNLAKVMLKNQWSFTGKES